jgi:hypothetical protein
MFIHKWVETNWDLSYNVILGSNEKERSFASCNNMGATKKHCTGYKLGTKEYYGLVYLYEG